MKFQSSVIFIWPLSGNRHDTSTARHIRNPLRRWPYVMASWCGIARAEHMDEEADVLNNGSPGGTMVKWPTWPITLICGWIRRSWCPGRRVWSVCCIIITGEGEAKAKAEKRKIHHSPFTTHQSQLTLTSHVWRNPLTTHHSPLTTDVSRLTKMKASSDSAEPSEEESFKSPATPMARTTTKSSAGNWKHWSMIWKRKSVISTHASLWTLHLCWSATGRSEVARDGSEKTHCWSTEKRKLFFSCGDYPWCRTRIWSSDAWSLWHCTNVLMPVRQKPFLRRYILDGSKCISYLTIELKSQIPDSFKGQMEAGYWLWYLPGGMSVEQILDTHEEPHLRCLISCVIWKGRIGWKLQKTYSMICFEVGSEETWLWRAEAEYPFFVVRWSVSVLTAIRGTYCIIFCIVLLDTKYKDDEYGPHLLLCILLMASQVRAQVIYERTYPHTSFPIKFLSNCPTPPHFAKNNGECGSLRSMHIDVNGVSV